MLACVLFSLAAAASGEGRAPLSDPPGRVCNWTDILATAAEAAARRCLPSVMSTGFHICRSSTSSRGCFLPCFDRGNQVFVAAAGLSRPCMRTTFTLTEDAGRASPSATAPVPCLAGSAALGMVFRVEAIPVKRPKEGGNRFNLLRFYGGDKVAASCCIWAAQALTPSF